MNGTKITVTNNLIYDNLGYSIQVNGTASYNPTGHPGPESLRSYDWGIANNTSLPSQRGWHRRMGFLKPEYKD
jgi:hypothetical protein